jgi:beta-alanine degradation protein BauB
MAHDPENIGDTELLFTTVEFLDSPDAPLEPHSRTRSAVGV